MISFGRDFSMRIRKHRSISRLITRSTWTESTETILNRLLSSESRLKRLKRVVSYQERRNRRSSTKC